MSGEGLVGRSNRSKEKSELEEARIAIDEIAQEFGLDYYPTHFDLVPSHKMYEYGAYGIPGRFSHWTHGRAYHQMKTMYDYNLSKIYELVINANPARAFLMAKNELIQQKLVIGHVLGHVDFFKNNVHFHHTNRQMIDTATLHADRIRYYENDHGIDEVEDFLDRVLTIQANFDPDYRSFNKPGTIAEYEALSLKHWHEQKKSQRPRSSSYDDIWELGEEKVEPVKETPQVVIPFEDERNLLWFIATFSPILEDWQKDITQIVLNEQQYFLPQMQTKIMNEGWAVFWHCRILRELEERNLLKAGEGVTWAQLHAHVVAPIRGSINPYYVGWQIYEDMDRKFRGEVDPSDEPDLDRFGERIDPKSFEGREDYNIWMARSQLTDEGFLRYYLTPNLIKKLDLYQYHNENGNWVVINTDPTQIKQMILTAMVNFGQPVIKIPVGGANYTRSRELELVHAWEGQDLDMDWAAKTLGAIYDLWGRPVHLRTKLDNSEYLFTFTDDKKIETKKI